MSKTASNMVALGTKASYFVLENVVTGTQVQLNEHSQHRATVICFICNHCPYVKHINSQLTQLANDFMPRDVLFIAINSNDADAYPDDSPEQMKRTAAQEQYPFPYLYDETQEVARAYNASCTPDFFVFDNTLSLIYRGQFDNSRPGNNIPVTGESLSQVLDCYLNKEHLDMIQKPSLGCNIKWK